MEKVYNQPVSIGDFVFVRVRNVKVTAATQLWIPSLAFSLRRSETLEVKSTDFCPIKNPRQFSPHNIVFKVNLTLAMKFSHALKHQLFVSMDMAGFWLMFGLDIDTKCLRHPLILNKEAQGRSHHIYCLTLTSAFPLQSPSRPKVINNDGCGFFPVCIWDRWRVSGDNNSLQAKALTWLFKRHPLNPPTPPKKRNKTTNPLHTKHS